MLCTLNCTINKTFGFIKIVQKKLYKNKLYNNIILIKVAMISMKEAHREAKKPQSFIIRDIRCKRKLEYPTGNIHIISLGKGFERKKENETFNVLQEKRLSYEKALI